MSSFFWKLPPSLLYPNDFHLSHRVPIWPRLICSEVGNQPRLVPFPRFLSLESEKAKALTWKFKTYVIYYVGKASLQWETSVRHLSGWFSVVSKIQLTPTFLWLGYSRRYCDGFRINSSFCLDWMEEGLSLSKTEDSHNILSNSVWAQERHPTSCLAVSASASEGGNWTPFLRRSRYTSFTSLTSTPPGKPCDQVWIQEMVPELEQQQN